MKKLLAYLLAFAMLCVPLTACGGQKSPQHSASDEELSEIADKLYIDWYAYLIRCEELFGSMGWALSYLDPFFEDHSWDSLQIAWAAMNQAKFLAENVEPPETKMTSDDYDTLVRHGMDAGSFWLAVDSISRLRDSVLDDYGFYQKCLNSPSETIFTADDLACFEQWAHTLRQITDSYLHSFAIETDYLLLALSDVESSVDLPASVEKNCPRINAWRENNPQDKDGLLTQLTLVMEDLEALVARDLSSVVGQLTARLNMEKDLYAELDVANNAEDARRYIALRTAGASELVDFPTALPYPGWWADHDADFMYLWDSGTEGGENDAAKTIMPGDTIRVPPNQYLVKWPDVSKEDFLSYIVQIQRNQDIAQNLKLGKEGGVYLAYYESESAAFSLFWEENEAALMSDGSVCLAPLWYTYPHQDS